MNRQRFKLSSFCLLATAADFVDYIMNNAQYLMTCNDKVVEGGKTNPTKKMTSKNVEKSRRADFCFRPSVPGLTTNTALKAIASSSGNKRSLTVIKPLDGGTPVIGY